jgi:hypothetical protein
METITLGLVHNDKRDVWTGLEHNKRMQAFNSILGSNRRYEVIIE